MTKCWKDDMSFNCDNNATRTLCEKHWSEAVEFFRKQRTNEILKIIDDFENDVKIHGSWTNMLEKLQDLKSKISEVSK